MNRTLAVFTLTYPFFPSPIFELAEKGIEVNYDSYIFNKPPAGLSTKTYNEAHFQPVWNLQMADSE